MMLSLTQIEDMRPVIIAALVGMSVYLALIALLPRRFMAKSTDYTRGILQQLASAKSSRMDDDGEANSLLGNAKDSDDPLARLFFKLPGTGNLMPKFLKAGMADRVGGFFIRCLVVLVFFILVLKKFFPVNLLIAIAMAYGYGHWSIKRRIVKRNGQFIDNFPDALDMIVRSVRSGYPMNSAVRMVSDNMQPPVSTEFKKVADEVAYGSTLIESLQRLSQRIDEPDVHFFVVVLTVQQEIGGNLSEVLGNLSGIIRKRKHLRMKIKAVSSEGRTTAWVLGSMPVFEALMIMAVSPDHLTPLLATPLGNVILGATIAIVALGAFIVTRMVNIKV